MSIAVYTLVHNSDMRCSCVVVSKVHTHVIALYTLHIYIASV